MSLMPWAVPGAQPASTEPQGPNLLASRVLIGTPTRSREVGDNYRRCVDELRVRLADQVLPLSTIPQAIDGEPAALIASPELYDAAGTGMTGVLAAPHDLARTRDRIFRMFIERTTANWLLWWDDDVWCKDPHIALASMLTIATAKDVHILGALYPRKARDEQRIIEAVLAGKKNPLAHGFTINDMRMWVRKDHAPPPPHPWLLPINGVGFGFCLVSRVAAIALTERYRPEKSWKDCILGGKTVGLCHEILNEPGFPYEDTSFSEDYSFCLRAERAGFSVYAYVGPGAPMYHDGCDTFAADPECLLHMRKEGTK